jgi:cytochrome b
MMTYRTRVWDLPTRVFHWALLIAVVSAFITAKIGGNAMLWHMRIGLFIGSLLLWRLMWGFVGGHYARFLNFLPHPGRAIAYLQGKADPAWTVGHNPLGALSVFALLAVLIGQVSTGLIADDEIANTGPLAKFVSLATALSATGWHKHYGEWVMLALVLMHVAAILFYTFGKKEKLVPAMWHGDKDLEQAAIASKDTAASRLTALGLWLACAGLMAWIAVRFA